MDKRFSFSRILFISLLIITAAAASIFMIIESAEFYASFYDGQNNYLLGLFAAILNEVFLVIMAAIWLPKINLGGISLWHPGNLFIKVLMLVLFANTVGGATFNVVRNNLSKIQEQENRIQILQIREQQLLDTKRKLDLFIEQNQKVNTVLASRELAQVQEELIKLKGNAESKTTLWTNIIMVFLLRFTIQLSNITSVWIASWLYRQPLAGSIIHPHSSSKITNSNKKQKNKSTQDLNAALDLQPKVLPKNHIDSYYNDAHNNNNQNNQQQLKLINSNRPVNYQEKKQENNISSYQQAAIDYNRQNNIPNHQPPIANNDNDNLLPDKNYDDQALPYCEDIKGYLKQLAPNYSIADLCQSLSINYLDFSKLLYKNSQWSKLDVDKLKKYRDKIRQKFQNDCS